MKALLIVGLGGCLGSITRYGVYLIIARLAIERIYMGTLVVNLIGCFLIGILSGSLSKLSSHQILLLVTGFCGGFTTFSSFAIDGFKLLKDGMYAQILIYYLLSVGGGLALCIFGFYLVNKG